MQGLALSKYYYQDVIAPLIDEKFPAYANCIAAGLVGEGSQCFGFDDELSQDHDWGAAVCLWLTEDDYQTIGQPLTHALNGLSKTFCGYPCDNITALGQGRTGVLTIANFYRKFLAIPDIPQTVEQWLRIPADFLATATNGEVFRDDLGEFSRIRNGLRQGYPDDIKKKKLAYHCLQAAQSGQYNLPRIIQRNDFLAAQLALSEFITHSLHILFLLNNAYAPYYKWLFRAAARLPILSAEIIPLYTALCAPSPWHERINLVEAICQKLITALHAQHLSTSPSDFLLEHGYSIHQHITNPYLQQRNPWVV